MRPASYSMTRTFLQKWLPGWLVMTGSPVLSHNSPGISVFRQARSRTGSSFCLPFAKSNFRLRIHFIWNGLSEDYTFVINVHHMHYTSGSEILIANILTRTPDYSELLGIYGPEYKLNVGYLCVGETGPRVGWALYISVPAECCCNDLRKAKSILSVNIKEESTVDLVLSCLHNELTCGPDIFAIKNKLIPFYGKLTSLL
jgi:hypothetical protein